MSGRSPKLSLRRDCRRDDPASLQKSGAAWHRCPEGNCPARSVRFTVAGNEKQEFRARACFDTQQAAIMGILSGEVKEGNVLVVRYEGPRGGPGFSENFQVVLMLEMLGLRDVAVVTDSRFSGATVGALYVGYVTPEAQVGGPLAAVVNGDFISVSIPARTITLEVSEQEMRLRHAIAAAHRRHFRILVDWHLLPRSLTRRDGRNL
jgi:dihydroxyacid dehydratase/phosphogluconate dehydratase